LQLPYFYALFSVGMSLLLYVLYCIISDRPLFRGWGVLHGASFTVLLIAVCIAIDHIGMALGYWEYPHYDGDDALRKYIFEWAVALFYHLLSLLIGMRIFEQRGKSRSISLLLGMLLFVTPVGFVTEYLNLHVYSWRVLSMPLTDVRIGEYFLVFQTIGYWLMAGIPYLLYLAVDILAGRALRYSFAPRRREEEQSVLEGEYEEG
jgi:hypothetical protein